LPRARRHRPLLLAAAATFLAALGCVDNQDGGKTLYVFDNSSGGTYTKQVMVWNDVNAPYALGTGATAATPDRTFTSGSLSGVALAWGGLAVDSVSNRVYLLSEAGTVYVFPNASTASGTLSTGTTTFYSFNLGSTDDRYDSGVFGQLAVDPTTDYLYAVETTLTGTKSRVWRVASASGQYYTTIAASGNTTNSGGDTFGAGVAVMTGGEAFGLFGNGSTVWGGTGGISDYTGARIRLTSGKTFVSNPSYGSTGYLGNVIIGDSTGLTASLSYGALAYDNSNSQLYVLSEGTAPVRVWNRSQFGYTYNQAYVRSLPNDSGLLSNLRSISHPYDSDWLLGAYFTVAPTDTGTGTGGSNLMFWKAPSSDGGTPVRVTLPGSPDIRGMAIGGGD
jgi:hypothetical protein